MLDSIFEGIVYPDYDKPFLEYFGGFYESIFVGFHPFFTIDDPQINMRAQGVFSGSVELTEEEFYQLDESEYIEWEPSKAQVYGRNKNYPSDVDVIRWGEVASWEEVRRQCGFRNCASLQIALETNIGALKKVYSEPEHAERLVDCCTQNTIWMPIEGPYPPLVKNEILRIFRLNGYNEIILHGPIDMGPDTVNISGIDDTHFIDSVFLDGFHDVYSLDKEILFTVEWDSFFFLFCSSKAVIERSLEGSFLEGFYAGPRTEHAWYISNEY